MDQFFSQRPILYISWLLFISLLSRKRDWVSIQKINHLCKQVKDNIIYLSKCLSANRGVHGIPPSLLNNTSIKKGKARKWENTRYCCVPFPRLVTNWRLVKRMWMILNSYVVGWLGWWCGGGGGEGGGVSGWFMGARVPGMILQVST